MVAALRDDSDVFNIDAFIGAKEIIANISGQKYEGENVYAYRVILDHLRAATHLIGDGIFPGNKDQQYFVRRLIRRAVRFAKKLEVNVNFTKSVALTFIDFYGNEYTNLKDKQNELLKALDDEETKFRKTLENGLKEFEKIVNKIQNINVENSKNNLDVTNTPPLKGGARGGIITGVESFNLLQSYGFPIELTEELAKEKGLHVDIENFKLLKDKHAEESRTASAGKFKGGLGGDGEMEVKYHTATHLLHQALRDVLGNEVYQKGSNINGERLRFDFSFDRKMTDEEKKKVEDLVNSWIEKDFKIRFEELTQEEAKNRGAIGLFGEKYGEKVKVYTIGEGNTRDANTPSIEFCGGPHVEHTGQIGEGNKKFKISKEEAVSQGVRRIKAVVE
jgi:alanyl-tRNA synthetase